VGRLKDHVASEGDKPQFKPFKTMFDTDSGRAAIEIKIAVPNNKATSYARSNLHADLG